MKRCQKIWAAPRPSFGQNPKEQHFFCLPERLASFFSWNRRQLWAMIKNMISPYYVRFILQISICDISYAFSNYEYYLHPSTKYLVLELEQLMDLGSLDANADIFHSGYGRPPFLSCYFITTMLQSHFTIWLCEMQFRITQQRCLVFSCRVKGWTKSHSFCNIWLSQ